MASLRGWMFDHLGLKLVALVLSVMVYLYVYTGREAHMVVAFPLQVTGLPDSLAVSGSLPPRVEAELSGTGRLLLRLKYLSRPVEVDLAGQGPGRVTLPLGRAQLPLPPGDAVRVDRVLGPGEMTLRIEPRIERWLPVQIEVEGRPAAGFIWGGRVLSEPESVKISGAQSEVAALDAVMFGRVRVDGRRDTVVSDQPVDSLGPWLRVSPARARVKVPIETAVSRRFAAPVLVDAPGDWQVEPESITVEITAPQAFWARAEIRPPVGYVRPPRGGGKAPVRLEHDWERFGAVARAVPDSVRATAVPGPH
jgi:hypothetical protein